MTETLKVAVIGLGYFSQFHLAAWAAQEGARLVGVCDTDHARTSEAARRWGAQGFTDAGGLIETTAPDIVDIIAPPPAHDALVRRAMAPGRTIICQKPFCTSTDEARALTDAAEAAGTTLIIHENFRFQPWYRAIQDFLESGEMGQVYQARFALRPGDGRGPSAYLDRQPAFQTMPRLLVHETAVHFLDLFRWLFGPVTSLYADLRQLNPVIAGEDAGVLLLHHLTGVRTMFDGNRLSDHVAANMRFTMGEFEIEGEGGVLRLDGDGSMGFRAFGSDHWTARAIDYPVDPDAFGGGCVAGVIAHVVEGLQGAGIFENSARDYLTVMELRDLAYASNEARRELTV
ncbi:MAG: Gfo/Idh/MocA family oxidoreductase [Pseudomonadota bacterium]